MINSFDIQSAFVKMEKIDHLATLMKMLSITLWPCLYLTFTRFMVSFAQWLLFVTYQKHYQKLVLNAFCGNNCFNIQSNVSWKVKKLISRKIWKTGKIPKVLHCFSLTSPHLSQILNVTCETFLEFNNKTSLLFS